MRFFRIFVVGPHDEGRYESIRSVINRLVNRRADRDQLKVEVVTPEQNPSTDRFNDWIFSQIDTCDLLVADMTGFNPNVVYEVAFAHALGTPCAYIRFGESGSGNDSRTLEDIKHYFKFTLMPAISEQDFVRNDSSHLAARINNLLDGVGVSGKTILSDYYGTSPIDAEFVRGLAEGYYRNFIGQILEIAPPKDHSDNSIIIAIPDTFVLGDDEVKEVVQGHFGRNGTLIGQNSYGRKLFIDKTEFKGMSFFIDVPTAVLTVTESSKFKKIRDNDKYFGRTDLDRLTDFLSRKFAMILWEKISSNPSRIKWRKEKIEIIWLSELIGRWAGEELMNNTPIPRPRGFPDALRENGI